LICVGNFRVLTSSQSALVSWGGFGLSGEKAKLEETIFLASSVGHFMCCILGTALVLQLRLDCLNRALSTAIFLFFFEALSRLEIISMLSLDPAPR
jgi:hypothetical protein